jgi:hypothetical protein
MACVFMLAKGYIGLFLSLFTITKQMILLFNLNIKHI